MAAKAPVIIKKIKKSAGHGHHGGAWKVAYADFVTAMMAFFLLMWLINTTSPEQRRGIADYFAPASVSQSTSGSGGILAGTAMEKNGARMAGATSVIERLNPDSSSQGATQEDTAEGDQTDVSEQALDKARAIREEAEFQRAEMSLRQAMQDIPELAELSKHVLIDMTPEGMRIQLIDQEGRSMFAPSADEPLDRARVLLRAVSKAIAPLPNRLSISGYTDGGKPPQPGYTNWDLSSDRANAARRVLMDSGTPPQRIFQVSGKADSEPLFLDDPYSPGNRRIAIVLLREAPVLPSRHELSPTR